MSSLRITEKCRCGASIEVAGSAYRNSSDARNPRGAEEVIERWREDHKHSHTVTQTTTEEDQ